MTTINANLYDASKCGRIEDVQRYVVGIKPLDEYIEVAAEYGHSDVVDFLLSRRAKSYFALLGACRGGHRDILERMYALDDNFGELDEALDAAAEGGHVELIDRLIEMGAFHHESAMCEASSRGHLAFIDHMLKRDAYLCNAGLVGACEGGHLDIAKRMVALGGIGELADAKHIARKNGHTEIVDYLNSL